MKSKSIGGFTMNYIYLYGQIMTTQSFLLYGQYPKADGYAEIKERYHLLGGETGTAAAIIASLGCNLVLGGTHLGEDNAELILDYFNNKFVDTSKLVNEKGFQGVIDHVIIDQNTRTVFGQFGKYFSRELPWYEQPDEESIKNCTVVGTDPYFGEQIVTLCQKYKKQFATIDCAYDSQLNKHCSVNAISHQHLRDAYPNKTIQELYELYTQHSEGLIIFTFGENDVMYGRKNQEPKYFKPYEVNVVSTLGAGDSFKAGTIYALHMGMDDDELVRFACATAGCACENFPIPLNPPTLEQIHKIQGT
jgi:sugar/nucleoside kinase (ribokinase family)